MVPEKEGKNGVQSTHRRTGLHRRRESLHCNRTEDGEDECRKVGLQFNVRN